MRNRPIGPGVGGLYYPPLLQDADNKEGQAAYGGQPAHGAMGARLLALWAAIGGVARRAGRRVVDARMAQAQRLIDASLRRGQFEQALDRRGASRYY
jgi:hypothetical protein